MDEMRNFNENDRQRRYGKIDKESREKQSEKIEKDKQKIEKDRQRI